MPELPEVEALARALSRGGRGAPALVGRRFRELIVQDDTLFAGGAEDAARAAAELRGARVCRVWRRGKYLVVGTDRGDLVFHLRMTGDVTLDGDEVVRVPYQRALFVVTGGMRLRFTDPRRLGRAWWLPSAEALFSDLGPEPFDPHWTAERLRAALSGTRRAIKSALMEGERIAGLGNIWADEALFLAGIHPALPADRLDDAAAGRLLSAIREALTRGIEGASAHLAWLHRGARDQAPPGDVHLREGQACVRCQSAIQRIRIGGRSTYFCPRCQPIST